MTEPMSSPLPMASGGCSCCIPDAAPTPGSDAAETSFPAASGTSATYRVEGMTCGHCVGTIAGAVSALHGVDDVRVDLVAGGISPVTVTGAASSNTVRAAIEEAGYRVLTS
ncbi:cation transporter [Citricoccus nitrophenolicus]|uniref:Cation transporter n=1 Tax=Citricoccus nitrophenolicus TaxID=863575 RepID=A0ABV0IMD8_9MICC